MLLSSSSLFVIFSAIFWLFYEYAHGMPKNIGKSSSSNDGQHPISKETTKWLKQIIEFIDKNNPKMFNGIEQNEQIKDDEKKFNEKKNEIREKLKTSKKEQMVVTREDVKNFFALLKNFLEDIVTKMTKKLKKLETYNTFRIKKTIENEIKTPKKQKEVVKIEKEICSKHKISIEKDLLDKTAAFEAIQLFKKLQILNCLGTDEKQKELREYFDTYYYQQKQQELKSEEQKIEHALNRLSDDKRCISPCCATVEISECFMDYFCKERNCCECCSCCVFLPVNISLCAGCLAASTAIDACFCCGFVPYACVNAVKKEQNKKKQEKIEKHLEEITPP